MHVHDNRTAHHMRGGRPRKKTPFRGTGSLFSQRLVALAAKPDETAALNHVSLSMVTMPTDNGQRAHGIQKQCQFKATPQIRRVGPHPRRSARRKRRPPSPPRGTPGRFLTMRPLRWLSASRSRNSFPLRVDEDGNIFAFVLVRISCTETRLGVEQQCFAVRVNYASFMPFRGNIRVISGFFVMKATMTSDFNFETGLGLLSVARLLPTSFHLSTPKIARDKFGSQKSEI